MEKIIIEALEPYFDRDNYYNVISQNRRLQGIIRGKIKSEIKAIIDNLELDTDDFQFPISKRIENESDGFLLDTSKKYLDQLVSYRKHKN